MIAPAPADLRIDPELDRVREGTVLGGRYVVGRELGVGGMGLVVAAEDLVERRPVALKFLRRAALPKDVERFLREARAAECLRSEHITRLYDVGQVESGPPFLVMELLQGETLADRAARAPMELAEILDAILQTCEGVAVAHGRGIIHRDLKPANLFLTTVADGPPFVKILDFGVSKFLEAEGEAGITTTGNVVGSPSFAAPEQLTAPRDVGPKTDIWALGVVLYSLLGREPPFPGSTRVQIWMLVLNSSPVPLHELRPDLPRGLTDAVMRCLEKAPADRPANVGELARSLEPFANGPPVSGRIAALLEDATRAALGPESLRALPPPVRLEAPPPAAVPAAPPRPRRRVSLAVFAVLTATTFAFVLAAALEPRRGAGPVSAAAAEPSPSGATTNSPDPTGEPPAPAPPTAAPPAAATASSKPRRAPTHDARRDPRSYR